VELAGRAQIGWEEMGKAVGRVFAEAVLLECNGGQGASDFEERECS
jgi:hypothetical protein